MRDYDPMTGRYMQADPLGLVDGASVYGYVRQNPVRYTDPTGEFIPQAIACLINTWCRTAAGAVAFIAYGYLTDENNCYTWDEALSYGSQGAMVFWGVGKGMAPVFRTTGPFRKGDWWSTSQYWRVGWNRKGGNRVFRWYANGLINTATGTTEALFEKGIVGRWSFTVAA